MSKSALKFYLKLVAIELLVLNFLETRLAVVTVLSENVDIPAAAPINFGVSVWSKGQYRRV
jgi:hypothetical protein